MKVCSAFSLQSRKRGDSNKYTQYTIFNIKRTSSEIFLNLQQLDFFQGSEESVQNSRGKRAISFRTIEGLLHCLSICFCLPKDHEDQGHSARRI